MVDVRTLLIDPTGRFARQKASTEAREKLFRGGGGSSRSSVVFRGAPQQQAFIDRQRNLKEAQTILKKSEKKLLTKTERIKLEEILKATPVARKESTFARTFALSPIEKLRVSQASELEAQRVNLIRQQTNLDIIRKELENRFKVLTRISNSGNLLPPTAIKFNNDVEQLNKQQTALTKKQILAQAKIKAFKKPTPTRTTKTRLPRTPKDALPDILEFKARVKQEETIEPFQSFLSPASIGRVRELRKAGGEFGASAITSGAERIGFFAGASVGATLGLIEEGARTIVDIPRFGFETITKKPIKVEIKETPKQVKQFQQRFDFFAGRRPSFQPSQKEVFKAVADIPIVGLLTGATETVTPEGRVVISGRALRELGTTSALFFAPELIFAGAKPAKALIKGLDVRSARATRKIDQFFGFDPKGVVRVGELPKEAGLIRERMIAELIPPAPTKAELFARRQRELFAKTPSPKKLEAGSLEKIRRDFERLRKEQAGEFLPRQKQLQVEREELEVGSIFERLERPRVREGAMQIEFQLAPRQDVRFFEATGIVESFIPKVARRPRLALTSRTFFESVFAQGVGLRTEQFLGVASSERFAVSSAQAQKQLDKFKDLTLFATATRPSFKQAEKQAVREAEKFAEELFSKPRRRIKQRFTPRTRIRPKPIDTFKRPPRKPKIILLPEPDKEEDSFRTRGIKRKGFHVLVKTKGRFQQITKTPLTESSALGLGSDFVDRGVERSFAIRKSKRSGKRVIELQNLFNPLKFRSPKGKTKLPSNVFVEKTAFAIDTVGELQGITAKGLAQAEKNRNIKKVLKLRKKTKRQRGQATRKTITVKKRKRNRFKKLRSHISF